MKPSNMQVISANDLLSGDVVYLDASGAWTRALAGAVLIADGQEADALLREAKAQPGNVIDPYLIDVTVGPDGPIPSHIRERLRDSGPSFRTNLQRTPFHSAG